MSELEGLGPVLAPLPPQGESRPCQRMDGAGWRLSTAPNREGPGLLASWPGLWWGGTGEKCFWAWVAGKDAALVPHLLSCCLEVTAGRVGQAAPSVVASDLEKALLLALDLPEGMGTAWQAERQPHLHPRVWPGSARGACPLFCSVPVSTALLCAE